jgi:hypothetical protein
MGVLNNQSFEEYMTQDVEREEKEQNKIKKELERDDEEILE